MGGVIGITLYLIYDQRMHCFFLWPCGLLTAFSKKKETLTNLPVLDTSFKESLFQIEQN